MEFLSNEGVNALGDKLRSSLSEGDRLSIISSYFTVFAFGELKDELARIDELRFLFDEPTFVEQMAELKEPKEFVLSKRGRERGIGGTGLELTLRNNLNQRALAHECAEWVRSRATFKSAVQRGFVQSGSMYHLARERRCRWLPGIQPSLHTRRIGLRAQGRRRGRIRVVFGHV